MNIIDVCYRRLNSWCISLINFDADGCTYPKVFVNRPTSYHVNALAGTSIIIIIIIIIIIVVVVVFIIIVIIIIKIFPKKRSYTEILGHSDIKESSTI